jgi:zinc D-Ala-D-Ala carboxypeptidase
MTKHFTIEEARCNHCGALPPMVTIEKTAEWLERIRVVLGNQPMHINSWYRCPVWNARVGGVSDSEHLKGYAVDFTVKGLTPRQVQAKLRPLVGTLIGGLGCYKGFTHVDRRQGKAIWNG